MRKKLIAGGVTAAILSAIVLLFLYGGNVISKGSLSAVIQNNPAAVAVPFTEITQGVQSTIATRTNYLITSADELEKLWAIIGTDGEPPEIDFTKNVVAAIFAGEKPTAGYTVAVSKVTDVQSRVVTVTVTSPGDTCTLAEVITAPYQVIQLPATTLPFAHEDQTRIIECL